MLVVAGKQLHQQRVGTGGKMTLGHLRDLVKLGNHIFVHRPLLQLHADIGTGSIAQHLRIDMIPRTGDHLILYHPLYTLVDGGTRHTALLCHIAEGYAGILGDDFQYLSV